MGSIEIKCAGTMEIRIAEETHKLPLDVVCFAADQIRSIYESNAYLQDMQSIKESIEESKEKVKLILTYVASKVVSVREGNDLLTNYLKSEIDAHEDERPL